MDKPLGVVVVTSAVAGEGKSTTAANLAVVFAEADIDVLLIEADLRRPKVADYFGLERAVGLTNVLVGQVSVDEVLQEWGSGGVTVLASGSIPPNPAELLGSQNMQVLLNELRQRFDMIIIDAPPLLPVTDAAVAAARADGALVVTRYGKTTRAQLDSAIAVLHAVDAKVIGGVLNMVPTSEARVSSMYNGYGYYEDAAAPVAPRLQRRSAGSRRSKTALVHDDGQKDDVVVRELGDSAAELKTTDLDQSIEAGVDHLPVTEVHLTPTKEKRT